MARERRPIPSSPFHRYDASQLAFAQADAHLAAEAMKNVDPVAEAKYLDQVNDIATIIAWRKRTGRES